MQSATYTGYFANIDFNEEGKENRVDYLSFAVRPDAMNHFGVGTVGKTTGDRRIGYEAGLDTELGNKLNPITNEAVREARTLLNAGLHFPLNDKYGMQRGVLSTVIQPSYNFMQNAADIGIRLHGEYNISSDNNTKLIGGASYSTENNIGLQGYLGIQTNFNREDLGFKK